MARYQSFCEPALVVIASEHIDFLLLFLRMSVRVFNCKSLGSRLPPLLDDDLGYWLPFYLYQFSVGLEVRIPDPRWNAADDALFQEMLLEFLFGHHWCAFHELIDHVAQTSLLLRR